MYKTLIYGAISLIVLFGGCTVNPISGKEEFMLFDETYDIEIGEKYAPEIEKQLGGKIDNPEIQSYVNEIGQKVARVSHSPGWPYEFTAVNDKSVNAFALPGGKIYITKGMLEKLNSEAQLASILAHEAAHVVARDSSVVMSRELGLQLLLTAAAQSNAGRGVLTVADLTRQIIGLSYSREDERDADRAGMDYMVKAGYNPYGMVETMQTLEALSDSRPLEFFSTHPSPENRVEYLREKIQKDYPNLTGMQTGTDTYKTRLLERLN